MKVLLLIVTFSLLLSCLDEGGSDSSTSEGSSSSPTGTSPSSPTNTSPAPTTSTITIENDDSAISSANVTLTLESSDANEMYITNDLGCTNGGSYETYTTSKTWTLGQTNATATVYAKFKDDTGDESSCVSDSIVHDNTIPTSTSITINSGDTLTNSTSVTLILTSTGASEMYITNTSGCTGGGNYETYANSRVWTLGQTNTTAAVYVKYRDEAGNESSCINNNIVHDNIGPTSNTVIIDGNAAYTSSTSASLTLSSTDVLEMYITNVPGCASGGDFEAYTTSKAWSLGQTNSIATVYVKYRDDAGNESSCISDTITHDNTIPTSTSISIDGGVSSTNSTSVTLTVSAIGASEMYITNNSGCGGSGSYEAYTTSKAWTINQANTTATVYIKFKDPTGNETSCISDIIYHSSYGNFGVATTYTTGTTPVYVTAVNLDTDSFPDLISVDATSNQISVRLNDGTGVFGAATTYAVWTGTKMVEVRDLDDDGFPDLASGSVNYVWVRFNDGTGGFGAATKYENFAGAKCVRAEDVNGDGYNDLIMVASTSVSIRLNNGGGVFGAPTLIGGGGHWLVARDIDRDTFVDLLIGEGQGDHFRVRLNSGSGTFGTYTRYPTGDSPGYIFAEDINGDGDIDIISSDRGDNQVTVRLNNGDGTFGASYAYTTGWTPLGVFLKDLNGDGYPDLLVAEANENRISIRMNNGDGTFGAYTTISTGNTPYYVFAVDINGDSRPDLIISDGNTNQITVRFNISI